MDLKKGTASPLEGQGSSEIISVLGSTYTAMTPTLCQQLKNTLAPTVPTAKVQQKPAGPKTPNIMQMLSPPAPTSKS